MPTDFRLPRVYPLTDLQLSARSHVDQVRLLLRGGASLIQLREKQQPANWFYDQANAAVSEARKSGVRIIINDRVDIALACGAQGVHLGQDDMPPDAARRLLGPEAIIGYSTHNLNQAEKALTLPVDYIAIGPIFDTATKSDTSPTLGLNGLREVRKVLGNFPLVAIGGISLLNAASVIEAGADSVALISALLAAGDRITELTQTMVQSLALARET